MFNNEKKIIIYNIMKHIKLFENFDEWDPFGEESEEFIHMNEATAKRLMMLLNMVTVNGPIMIKVEKENLERFLKGMPRYYPEYIFPEYEFWKDYDELYFLKIGEDIIRCPKHYYNGKNYEYFTFR